ncbi:MAG: HAD family hydrolase [Thermoplasmata archaeon]|nr:HAD family hydrolase [Thermoplasmata archaeon]
MRSPLIIFDVDGTLVDTMEGMLRAFEEALSLNSVDVDWSRVEEIMKEGPSLTLFLHSVLHETDQAVIERVAEDYKRIYFSKYTGVGRGYPGVERLLRELKKKGFVLSAVSNKRGETVRRILNNFQLKSYFRVVLGADEVPAPKPSPSLLLRSEELTGGRAIWMVGDTSSDLKAARSAGIPFAWASWGYGSGKVLREESDLVLSSPVDLLLHVNSGVTQ